MVHEVIIYLICFVFVIIVVVVCFICFGVFSLIYLVGQYFGMQIQQLSPILVYLLFILINA